MDDVDIEKVQKYVDSINNSELVDLKSRYEAEIAKLRSEIKYLRVNQILKEIEIEMSQNTESNSIFRTANRSRNNQEILKVGQQFIDSRYSRNWDKKSPNQRNMRGGQPYYYPVGFYGIGLQVKNFDENTCIAYYEVNISNLPSILREGFKLPSELRGGNSSTIQLNLTIFDVQNYSNAIFLSPSINYASLFGTQYNSSYLKIPLNKILITVLQCRVKPNSYTVHPNTTLYDANDPYYNNDNIE